MRRRELLATAAAVALLGAGSASWGQDNRRRRVGALLGFAQTPEGEARLEGFSAELMTLGWDESRLELVVRWAGGSDDALRAYIKEFASTPFDAILAGSSGAVLPLARVVKQIPIVFVGAIDPVAAELVSKLSGSGSNVTGFMQFEPSAATKLLEILQTLSSDMRHAGIIYRAGSATADRYLNELGSAAARLGLPLQAYKVNDAADIEHAFKTFAAEPGGGLVLPQDLLQQVHRALFVKLAAQYRTPAVSGNPYYARAGGLAAYGVDQPNVYRLAASYVDRILRGERAGDLPIQSPIKFELVLNRATAKRLGIDLDPSLLATADEVIE